MRRALLAAVLATVLLPAAAWGGGFATVGLSSDPATARPGQPWVVDITVLQHGRTPLDGVRPRVLVGSRAFAAQPTGRSGVYRARVVFPRAGAHRFAVDDGFTSVHRYAPVRIRAAAAPARTSGTGPDWLAAAGAAALVAAAALGARRLRRTT